MNKILFELADDIVTDEQRLPIISDADDGPQIAWLPWSVVASLVRQCKVKASIQQQLSTRHWRVAGNVRTPPTLNRVAFNYNATYLLRLWLWDGGRSISERILSTYPHLKPAFDFYSSVVPLTWDVPSGGALTFTPTHCAAIMSAVSALTTYSAAVQELFGGEDGSAAALISEFVDERLALVRYEVAKKKPVPLLTKLHRDDASTFELLSADINVSAYTLGHVSDSKVFVRHYNKDKINLVHDMISRRRLRGWVSIPRTLDDVRQISRMYDLAVQCGTLYQPLGVFPPRIVSLYGTELYDSLHILVRGDTKAFIASLSTHPKYGVTTLERMIDEYHAPMSPKAAAIVNKQRTAFDAAIVAKCGEVQAGDSIASLLTKSV